MKKEILVKCPHCGVSLLLKGAIRANENRDHISDVRISKIKNSEYYKLDFTEDHAVAGDSYFYCIDCNEELPITNDDVIEMLKLSKKRSK